MSIQNDIDELIKAGAIEESQRWKVLDFYLEKSKQSKSRQLTVFLVFGALLVGLGIILIIAHNWDSFPKLLKSIFAFLPVVIGQVASGLLLFGKKTKQAYKEAASVFLFFAIGACISLVSQIYHIEGNLSEYLLLWMFLVLPQVYLMNSGATSLLYLIGITAYGVDSGYGFGSTDKSHIYFLLLALVVPYIIYRFRQLRESNFTFLHSWFVPLSLMICLGILASDHGYYMVVAYVLLFSAFVLVSRLITDKKGLLPRGFYFLGFAGQVVMFLALSFDDFWMELWYNQADGIFSLELIVTVLILSVCILMVPKYVRPDKLKNSPEYWIFIPFMVVYLLGYLTPLAQYLMNAIVLAIGILVMMRGIRTDHLGILNLGLLIISALIASRFFDTSISFIIRGVSFLVVGSCFFVANYLMIKNRRDHG